MNLPTLEDATRSPVRTTSAVGGSGVRASVGRRRVVVVAADREAGDLEGLELEAGAWADREGRAAADLNSCVPLTVIAIVATGIEMSRSPVGRRVTSTVPRDLEHAGDLEARGRSRSSENVLPTMLIDVVGARRDVRRASPLVLIMNVAVPRDDRPGRPSSVTVPVA